MVVGVPGVTGVHVLVPVVVEFVVPKDIAILQHHKMAVLIVLEVMFVIDHVFCVLVVILEVTSERNNVQNLMVERLI